MAHELTKLLTTLRTQVEELERVCEAGEWVRLREGQKLCTQVRW